MKKKLIIIAAAVLLVVLFVPIPRGSYDDGGTQEFEALTYKIVRWNKLMDIGSGGGTYKKTRVYFLADKNKSIDELWEREAALLRDARPSAYTGEWLDKETAVSHPSAAFSDIVITEIYADCFFARSVIPMPYTIKLNGTLSDEWCVGDQVTTEIENAYFDSKTQRYEADMISIAPSDFEPDPFVCYKPVIYLYPEAETEVEVALTLSGALTCTYPAYRDGWRVTASPDGTLTDDAGQTYSYLYWEGETDADYDFSTGFCIKGDNTAAFLEDALASLGLTRREANEFIVYWLPLMQENPYNLISFQTDAYTDAAALDITPSPDTMIRVFMAWTASDTFVDIKPQTLTAPAREGFTAVEWGGTELR